MLVMDIVVLNKIDSTALELAVEASEGSEISKEIVGQAISAARGLEGPKNAA